MIYRKILIVLILLWATCPIYSQITKFKHSTTIAYDSGVAMPLNTYRAIRSKSILMDSLVANMKDEIALKDTIINGFSNTIYLQNEKVKSYEETIDILEKKNKPFLQRKETYISIVLSGLFVYLIK